MSESPLGLLGRAAILGTVAGMRSLMAPAVFSAEASRSGLPALDDPPLDLLALRPVAAALCVMAAGELVVDKLPITPARTALPSLVVRTLSGAMVGAALFASEERPRAQGALIGGLAAVAATFGAYQARRALGPRLKVPDPVLGALEDGLALGAALAALRAVPWVPGVVSRNARRPSEATAPDSGDDLPNSPASEGAGPLLQRDYWGAIHGASCEPEQVIRMLLADFLRFSPDHLARFTLPEGTATPLSLGAKMAVHIRGAGTCHVRVMHLHPRSLTMHTLSDHPEAGRITFAAYRGPGGELVFRIRSRARASDPLRLAAYQMLGQAVQTEIWTEFIRRVAQECGGQIQSDVQVETAEVDACAADEGRVVAPTFAAQEAT